MRSIELSVIDFDGTLIPFNSFPRWVLHIFLCALKTFSLYQASKILILLLKRKAGFLSHKNFKKQLIENKHPIQWDISFAQKMEKKLDYSVIAHIIPYINNTTCVISSAAPARYISQINFQKYLPIHTTIGSYISYNGKNIDINENFQQKKLQNIICKFPYARIKYVITDHHDDIPLIDSSQKSIIINPTKKTKQLIIKNKKTLSVLFFKSN